MMRHLRLLVLVVLAGCNNDIYVRDGVTDGDTFFLAPIAMVDTDPALQSWVAYSLTRSVCQLELGGENPARASSFDCEFRARDVLADAWAEHRADNRAISDDYLDALLAVRAAGYLREYTAHYFRRDDWREPVEANVKAFDDWRREHLRGHRPQTRIVGSWGYKSDPVECSSEARETPPDH